MSKKKLLLIGVVLISNLILAEEEATINIKEQPYFSLEIYLDGKNIGDIEQSLTVKPGKHILEFKTKEENMRYGYKKMELNLRNGDYENIDFVKLTDMGSEEYYLKKWEESKDINYLINMKECYPKSEKINFINSQIKNSEKKYGKIRENEVVVKSGKYIMGRFEKYRTPIEIEINYDFIIAKKEVSQKEYNDLMNIKYDSKEEKIAFPVELKWLEAVKYCNRLSKKYGFAEAYSEKTGELLDKSGNITQDITKVEGYRMATEAEWEYAAIGGHLGEQWREYFKLINKIEIEELVQTRNITVSGQKRPDILGLYDMIGNVREWCSDWYDSSYSSQNRTYINPYNAKENEYKEKNCRGGYSSYSRNDSVSVSTRGKLNIDESYAAGLRVVRGVIK